MILGTECVTDPDVTDTSYTKILIDIFQSFLNDVDYT